MSKVLFNNRTFDPREFAFNMVIASAFAAGAGPGLQAPQTISGGLVTNVRWNTVNRIVFDSHFAARSFYKELGRSGLRDFGFDFAQGFLEVIIWPILR